MYGKYSPIDRNAVFDRAVPPTGQDAFFKTHKDTLRSEEMIGSLVLVFPTKHEGGSLILRDDGQEWTFDSAKAVNKHEGPCIGYVALYSDVEHEVALVTRKCRVTLTYNLYLAARLHRSDPSSTPSSCLRCKLYSTTLLSSQRRSSWIRTETRVPLTPGARQAPVEAHEIR